MLEKPELEDGKIIACLREAYGLWVENIVFLPLGADFNTAVYRATANDGTTYFVKLRRGEFNEACVAVPNFLSSLGIPQIIPAVATQTGRLWTGLTPFIVMLYPFVEGQNGFDKRLSEQQWVEFGAALKRFHTADIPATITGSIPREDFSARWRDTVKMFLRRIEAETFDEPVASTLAAFLKTKKEQLLEMVERAERFAHRLQERDLMCIGGGLGDSGYTPEQEESLFYRGYGSTDINQVAMAYYRYERILEDIAVYCEQLLLSEAGGEDRNQSLEIVKFYFQPEGTVERTYQCDKISNESLESRS